MAQQGNFKFNHTFQGIEFANGICNFHYIFYIVFYLRKLFYAPCEVSWKRSTQARTTEGSAVPSRAASPPVRMVKVRRGGLGGSGRLNQVPRERCPRVNREGRAASCHTRAAAPSHQVQGPKRPAGACQTRRERGRRVTRKRMPDRSWSRPDLHHKTAPGWVGCARG